MKIRVLIATGAVLAALGLAACGSSSTTTAGDTSGGTTSTAATQSTATTATTATTGAVDAKALFVDGNPATGAAACGSCHMLKAAGTTGAVGPDLDAIAPDDKADALKEMIVDPDAEIVTGFTKGIMPATYGKTLTAEQVDALAAYIDTNSAHSGD